MNTIYNKIFELSKNVYSKTIASDIVPIKPSNKNETIKIPYHWFNKKFDGRLISKETINWKNIKKGDVLIHGELSNDKNPSYITLTKVNGKHWEYFENGYYKSTSPEFCHWVVKGQKNCNGKIMRIKYE